MKKILSVLMISIFLFGCATVNKSNRNVLSSNPASNGSADKMHGPPAKPKNAEQENIPKHGVVFAKTDFEGVLKSSYVKLAIINQADPRQPYNIYIGDKTKRDLFAWEVEAVEPGYFFLELPAGDYKIASISIPVGASMATEDMNIAFSVIAEEAVYLGTLKVFVSKEKIRLGGVPVIKPGFEYEAEVFDQSEEGKAVFKLRYPDAKKNVRPSLMVISP